VAGHRGDLGDIEVMERFAEGVALAEDDGPVSRPICGDDLDTGKTAKVEL